jgi:methylenetetrahydrofolate dehydrogenase (NADP+)/methenyltetrahydrofolate cyclohydrolase
MQILDGKTLSEEIKNSLKTKVANAKSEIGLAVILVGDDPASNLYVSMKQKACEFVGIKSILIRLPENISEDILINEITKLNNQENIDGILVQLPLPHQIDTQKILSLISPEKDVDGFHPVNIGKVLLNLKDGFASCTPLGMVRLLEKYNLQDLRGKNAVVVGASNIVGKPIASLLLNLNATVDICHIYTKNLKEHTLKADILVVAVGKANLITEDMVKDEVIVLDVGINKLENGKIVGDVDFENVSKKASFITPVPGGVGPMTIAMLLENTIKSAELRGKF